jgi:predicted DNA-binding protein
MANMRKKGKKLQTLWLSPEEMSELASLAKRAGMNKSEYLKQPITESLNKKSK